MTGRDLLVEVLRDSAPEGLADAAEGLAHIIADRIESDAQEGFLAALEKVLDEEKAGE